MVRSADYKGLVRQVSVILFIILALYLVVVRPLARQGSNVLQGQIEDATAQVERFIPRQDDGFLPTTEVVQALETNLAQEKKNYLALKSFFDPPREYLPADTQEGGLYFIEQLHITTKRLKRQANTLKIKIPDNFGFSEEMPRDLQNVEILLKELDVVERITTLLMEQGVAEISLIRFLEVVEQRDEQTQQLIFRELPLQLSYSCNSATLIKFLYYVKNFSPALVVKDIIVKRTNGTSLQVEMLLSRLVVS